MNSVFKNLHNLLKINGVGLHNNCKHLTYKSSISLETLYPGCNTKLTTPEPPQSNEKFSGYIPIRQLDITFSKSSGPGGQNVNKVNTKADVRFHLQSASWINENIKKKLAEKNKSRITANGFLVYRSDLTRSQQLNLADCLNKLRTDIRETEIEKPVQTPETAEKIRRRYEKAIAERLLIKRNRSISKNDRRAPDVNI